VRATYTTVEAPFHIWLRDDGEDAPVSLLSISSDAPGPFALLEATSGRFSANVWYWCSFGMPVISESQGP
jgi:hypothetical protein